MQDISMLRKLQQVRSDFVTNASHELRTPLTAIQGYAETLLDKENGKKKQRQQFIVRIYEQAIYLSGLISDLLNLSEIESCGLQLNFENCKIADLRKKITNLFEPLFSESKMNFEWKTPDNSTGIYVDPELITQVLVNLIDNAIKYTEPDGTISVSVQTEEHNIIFQVKDTGIGIPKRELERIFERFYRVDTVELTKSKELDWDCLLPNTSYCNTVKKFGWKAKSVKERVCSFPSKNNEILPYLKTNLPFIWKEEILP